MGQAIDTDSGTTETIDLGGVAVTFETASAAITQLVHNRFGSRKADPRAHSVRLQVRERTADDDRSLTALADDVWHQIEGCQLTETDSGAILNLGEGPNDAVVEGPDVTVRFDPRPGADLKPIGALMQFGVALAMATPTRLLAHGAALADGNEAVLVVGLSGQGKSTAALAGVTGGLSLLGDDLATVDVSEMTVAGVQRKPVVPADQAAYCGEIGEPIDGLDDRRRVRLENVAPTPEPARLIGLVVVGHHDRGGALTELKKGDLAVLDRALAIPPFPMVLRRHLPAMAALAGLPAAELLHAADPAHRLDRSAELLGQAFTLFRQR